VTGLARCLPIAALLAVRTAAAQTPASPPATPPARPAPPPLSEIKDEKQLTQALAQITSDPAIPTPDPSVRATAQALLLEGVKRLQAGAYDQALANFLDAYAKLPSPKLLLTIGSTLREMGRLADAANTYQRYLDDPATGARAAEVAELKELLSKLDEQLTLLEVAVTPRGAAVSIDGGPFIAVGQLLVTRVRPGLHLVRIRKGERGDERTINGFEGERKRVELRVEGEAQTPTPTPSTPTPGTPPPTTPPPSTPPSTPPAASPPEALPERVHPWLTNGTQYTADSATGRVRRTRSGYAGAEIAPVIPLIQLDDEGEVPQPRSARSRFSPGAIALLRIDGKLRGVAAGLGLAIARGRFEGNLLALQSEETGAYLGLRVRLRSGLVRPYVAGGVPAFLYDDLGATKLAFGLRAAAGAELTINQHFSVQGDLGYEHFFGVEETMFEADVIVPTLGLIGRM
jgi:hypothetical protein